MGVSCLFRELQLLIKKKTRRCSLDNIADWSYPVGAIVVAIVAATVRESICFLFEPELQLKKLKSKVGNDSLGF